MDDYICTIVDSDGFTVEEFKHRQTSLDDAERFELLVLKAVQLRDLEPRYIAGDINIKN